MSECCGSIQLGSHCKIDARWTVRQEQLLFNK
jgi:hypothetical protein